tara:strand:- start:2190 stop:2315 length:126 start_codon:yes stop_codon:yes gene_type:complete
MATKLAPRFGSMTRAAKKEFVTEALEKNREGGSCLCFSKTY